MQNTTLVKRLAPILATSWIAADGWPVRWLLPDSVLRWLSQAITPQGVVVGAAAVLSVVWLIMTHEPKGNK